MFLTPFFAVCGLVFFLLIFVRSLAQRDVFASFIPLIVGTAYFVLVLRRAFLQPGVPTFFYVPVFAPADGLPLVRYVIGFCCLIGASLAYLVPVLRRGSGGAGRSTPYLAVLAALFFLGLWHVGTWERYAVPTEHIVTGPGGASMRAIDFPSPSRQDAAFAYFLYLWVGAITAAALADALGKPATLGRVAGKVAGGLASVPLVIYEIIRSRPRASRRQRQDTYPSFERFAPLTATQTHQRVAPARGGTMPNPEDRPLVPSSGIAASPVERSKHFFQHLLQKRQLRRDRQTLEEITKNTRAAAEAARAVGDLEKERNRAALQAGRATHVPPRLEAEESEYHATTAENQARRAEAEGRRAAALRSAEASSQPRSSVADDLTKRMEKLTRRFEQQNKQGADREALTAWARGSWGADIDFLRARGDEVGAQRLEQQLQHILDDIATGEA